MLKNLVACFPAPAATAVRARQQHPRLQRCCTVARCARQAPCQPLTTVEAARAYVASQPNLLQLLGITDSSTAQLDVQELSEGKINYTFLVRSAGAVHSAAGVGRARHEDNRSTTIARGRADAQPTSETQDDDSVAAKYSPAPAAAAGCSISMGVGIGSQYHNHQGFVLKYSPPYVKSAGASAFPLDQARQEVERSAMELMHTHCPQHIPSVLHYDGANHVMAVQWLPPPHDKLMTQLHRDGAMPHHLAASLAFLMSSLLFYTSECFLTQGELATNLERFNNADIVAANERVVLIEPLDASCPSNRTLQRAALQEAAAALRSDPAIQHAVQELVHVYRTQKQALIHNDLHTGNLLCTTSTLYCIDWEFATVGPASFDLGCLIGVLLLAHVTLSHQGPAEVTLGSHPHGAVCDLSEGRATQRAWMISTLSHFWDLLLEQLKQLRAGKHSPLPQYAPLDGGVCADVVGFAATTIIRLTIGMHAYPGYSYIPRSRREACEVQALGLAAALIRLRAQLQVEARAAASGRQGQGLVESLVVRIVGLL